MVDPLHHPILVLVRDFIEESQLKLDSNADTQLVMQTINETGFAKRSYMYNYYKHLEIQF